MYRINRLLILALSLLFIAKLGALFWIQKDPLFLFPQIDGKEYCRWANSIYNGEWFQKKPFYQAPLYPYLLAISYFVFGDSLFFTALLQILLSVGISALVYKITLLTFDKKTAWIAFFLVAFTGNLYFYEFQPLKTIPALFFTALVLYLLLKFSGFSAGVASGILILLRGNTFLLLPFFCWFLWQQKKSVQILAFYLLGLFLPLSFSMAHNYNACGELILSTYQGGTNFYIGNHPKANGSYQPLLSGRQTPQFEGGDAIYLAEKITKRSLSYREVSRFWFLKGLDFYQQDPVSAFKLQLYKLWLYFWPGELPDGIQYSFWRVRYPFLMGLGVGYGLLWGFTFIGIFSLYRGKREGTKPFINRSEIKLLLLFLGGSLLSVVPFFIFTRYRLPVIIGLYPFAAYGIVCLLKKSRICFFFVLSFSVFLEFIPTNQSNSYYILGTIELKRRNFKTAEQALRASVKEGINPEAWNKLGELYFEIGDWRQAKGCFEKSIGLNPKWAHPYFGLGSLYLVRSVRLGNLELERKAMQAFQKSIQFSLQKDKIYAKIAQLYYNYFKKKMNPHHLENAINLIEKAILLNPQSKEWQNYRDKFKKNPK